MMKTKLKNIVAAGLFCIVAPLTCDADLYFPHVITTSAYQTEIAVINTSANQTVTGTLNSFNDNGQLLNTKDVTLAPHARTQLNVADELTDFTGTSGYYIVFNTNSETVQGYTKFFHQGFSRTATPAIKEAINTPDTYISHIHSDAQWWTGVSLANTTGSEKMLTLEFDDRTTRTLTLAANGHNAFLLRDLFNGQTRPDLHSAVINNSGGVIGLELFGTLSPTNPSEDGIPISDKLDTDLYYPHIESRSPWWTGIVVYNPHASQVNITIKAYDETGALLSSLLQNIGAGEKYIGITANLGLPDNTAWLHIHADRPVSGFELFGTGSQLAGYSVVDIGTRNGVFAKIEKNGWTGIAFVNTADSQVSVTLTAYNDSGTVIATQPGVLNGHAKIVRFAENFFTQRITNATYITFAADKNIVGFQLNGSSDSTMLDALPALAFSSTGSPVPCTDADGDGYYAEGNFGTSVDCNDKNTAVHPDATETCDGIDNDCDGLIDEGLSSCTNGGQQGGCLGDYCRYGDDYHMTWVNPVLMPTINQRPIIDNTGHDGAFSDDGSGGQLLAQYPGCPLIYNLCACSDTSNFVPGADVSLRMKLLVNGQEGDNGAYFNEPFLGYTVMSHDSNFLFRPLCFDNSGIPPIGQTDLATNPIITDDLSFAYFCDADNNNYLDSSEPVWRMESAQTSLIGYYCWNGSRYVERPPVFGLDCSRIPDTGQRITMVAAENFITLQNIDEEAGLCMWAMDIPAVIVTPAITQCATISVKIELTTDVGGDICSDATIECSCIYDLYTVCCSKVTRQIDCLSCTPGSL